MIRWEETFVEKLVSNEIINEKEADLYQFGIECLVLKLIHCISYLCIAACFQMVPQLIVIGCVLIPLRRNAGGYHAKTKIFLLLYSHNSFPVKRSNPPDSFVGRTGLV